MNIVETDRLILKPFDINDVDEYFEVASDSDIWEYVPYEACRTKKGCNKLISDYIRFDFKNNFAFKIVLKDTNEIVGGIIANKKVGTEVLDVCFFISKKFRGNKYSLEALQAFIVYLSTTNYHSLQFTIEDSNIYSQRIVEALGAESISRYSKSEIWSLYLNPYDLLT